MMLQLSPGTPARRTNVRAVDVGDKVDAEAAGVRPEGLGDHDGPEVAAADANVHDVGDGLARVALPRAAAHLLGEHAHVRQHAVDVGHDVAAVDQDGRVGAVAQRHVQDRAVLRAARHP